MRKQTALSKQCKKLNRMIAVKMKDGSFALNHTAILKQSRKVDQLLLRHEGRR